MATVNDLDMILSLNFKHIAKRTIELTELVNAREGYHKKIYTTTIKNCIFARKIVEIMKYIQVFNYKYKGANGKLAQGEIF